LIVVPYPSQLFHPIGGVLASIAALSAVRPALGSSPSAREAVAGSAIVIAAIIIVKKHFAFMLALELRLNSLRFKENRFPLTL
jgi:hypothetical protein